MKDEFESFLIKLFFSYAWKYRPKKCQITGLYLPKKLNTAWMDHLLEKSVYPECKYSLSNIFFVHPNIHSMKTNGFPHKEHEELMNWALNNYDILVEESYNFEERIRKKLKLEENELHNKK